LQIPLRYQIEEVVLKELLFLQTCQPLSHVTLPNHNHKEMLEKEDEVVMVAEVIVLEDRRELQLLIVCLNRSWQSARRLAR
jgi:hypothetical protein